MPRLALLIGWIMMLTMTAAADSPARLMPVIDGDWWPIAGNPELGEYQTPAQEPVDFCIWQAADGTWQLWSCIRNTAYPGHTRLLYGWETDHLTDRNWRPMGIKMTSRPDLGEAEGGLQAPHVVRDGDRYIMAYGDWENICFAESRDGKDFERILRKDGTPAAFSEGPRANSRDPMLIRIGGLWHCYYTAIVAEQGYIFCRTSADLIDWSPSIVVNYGGSVGNGRWWSECPFVVEPRPGEFVLFRNQYYGAGNLNWVYASRNPLNFGIDHDLCLVGSLPVGAPEIIQDGADIYIAALNPALDGIRLARLQWARLGRTGQALFDFDDPAVREEWRQSEGDLPFVFTDRTHVAFRGESTRVIGTAETPDENFNDAYQGVIESPAFELTDDYYLLLVSGGEDRERLYVSLVREHDGEELARWTGRNNHEFSVETFDASAHQEEKVRVRVTDRSSDPWGHINFGGIFRQPVPQVEADP